MVKVAEAKGTVEAWLRQLPGPMFSEVSPQRVFQDAHKIYAATCSEPVGYGEFVDHLWGRGLVVEQVGGRYWLRLPGRNKSHLQIVNTPTRIAG